MCTTLAPFPGELCWVVIRELFPQNSGLLSGGLGDLFYRLFLQVIYKAQPQVRSEGDIDLSLKNGLTALRGLCNVLLKRHLTMMARREKKVIKCDEVLKTTVCVFPGNCANISNRT